MTDFAALIAAARTMLPPGVGLGWADPRLTHEVLAAERLPAAVPKRQREFSAGRAAARAALGLPGQPLPMRPDRTPVWPPGMTGSITHSDHACLAISAPLRQFRGLGIDIEPDVPLDRDLWDTVLSEEDRSWVGSGRMAKLIFTAKEAIFKAQYPISEHLLGFDALSVRITEQSFTTRLSAAVPGFPCGTELSGQWTVAGGHFLTFAAIRA